MSSFTTAHIVLTRGTVETLYVEIFDRMGNLTSLVSAGCTFTVKDRAGADKVTNVACTVNGANPMIAECLVNTNVGGLWAPGKYYLSVAYTANPDAPILGGMEFSVIP